MECLRCGAEMLEDYDTQDICPSCWEEIEEIQSND